ncbi:hypothetical protein O181_055846 [Austropuccinia psidii MF-1]|uniref:Uncharacterized protein n=1 Tax=Austropuccinia psidii MF-1 TaxID=1389203 RepID=A0A9Q3HSF3_9BASI|nr:hypothetical protein [Austropuccinia psidii MF-1]
MCLPEVELSIETWEKELVQRPSEKIDYCHSNAWTKLNSETLKYLNKKGEENVTSFLSFSLFIDLFNPLGNKLSGKQISLGILALTCLNLPPSLQYKPKYTYLAGVIPAPNQPNTTMISNVLKPLVDDLLNLYRTVNIKTFQFPNGQKINVRLGALLGDRIATHKTAGFLSHSANAFCSWCTTTKANIDKIQIKRPRDQYITKAVSY